MCDKQIAYNISFNADTFGGEFISFARIGASSENGLVCSGFVVICAIELGRGGIMGFVSIKLCRGLWILLGVELALEKD